MMRNPDLTRSYLALLRESATLAEAQGIALGDYSGFPVHSYLAQSEQKTLQAFAARAAQQPSAPRGDEQLPSMTYDLLSQRALEVDEVFGDLVARADRIGLAVPRLTLVRDLIRGIDPGRQS